MSEARHGLARGLLMAWLGTAFVVVVTDRLTKDAIEAAFAAGQSRPVTSFFNLVLAYNRGAAFSFLADEAGWQRYAFMVIAIVAAAFILWLLVRHAQERLFSFALALILGGALGNLWDRATLGHVVDFLDFHAAGVHFPAFNIADSAITLGAGLLILEGLLAPRRAPSQATPSQ